MTRSNLKASIPNHPPATPPCGLNPTATCRAKSETPQSEDARIDTITPPPTDPPPTTLVATTLPSPTSTSAEPAATTSDLPTRDPQTSSFPLGPELLIDVVASLPAAGIAIQHLDPNLAEDLRATVAFIRLDRTVLGHLKGVDR